MKKSPLKRKKGLKRSPIKKRGKATAYEKCDRLWAKLIKDADGWRCQICGRARPYQMHAHHVISRERHFYRHNLVNGICLCALCHLKGSDDLVRNIPRGFMSAHRTPRAFHDWLEENRPDQWAWFIKNRHKTFPGLRINYDEVLEELRNN